MESADKLTGLPDRETFDRELSIFIDDAKKNNTPVGLIMVDLDHFKKVNDTLGHQKGDSVLQEVSALIKHTVMGKGKAYRYGGEEIVVLLSNHTGEETLAAAERARRSLESQQVAGLSITASFGVSVFPDHADGPESLLKTADEALYDAKNKGRNLVRLYGEPDLTVEKVREPQRKSPKSGMLTDQQRRKLHISHFQGRRITCPMDGAVLEVFDVTGLGDRTRSISVNCPVCSLGETLQAPER